MPFDNDRYPGPASYQDNQSPVRKALFRSSCDICSQALEELDRQAIASGRLRLEVMDLRTELKKLKGKETAHVPDRAPPAGPVAAARCTHGVILSNRCAYCGKVWDDCEPT